MFIIVTGGSGFLGSHVAEQLSRRGHEVAVFDVVPPAADLVTTYGLRFIQGDLADLESVERGFAGADVVCHLGGVGDVYLAANEPYRAATLNATGTANVAEAAVRQNLKKLVYASTWEVYGKPQYEPLDEGHPCNPDHPYNITKYAGELLALSYDHLKGLPVLALRLGTAFGTRMRPNSVFSLFINRARNGEPLTIQGNGEQSRQFTHARDIARAFALGAESDAHGLALNTVASESTSIKQLATLVQARFPTEISFLPPRAGDISPAVVSSAKAQQVLGWSAEVSFETGLNELMEIAARVPVA